jgi:hypothetical protein
MILNYLSKLLRVFLYSLLNLYISLFIFELIFLFIVDINKTEFPQIITIYSYIYELLAFSAILPIIVIYKYEKNNYNRIIFLIFSLFINYSLYYISLVGFIPNEKAVLRGKVIRNMETLQMMLETYYVENNKYPTNDNQLYIDSKKNNYYKELKNPYSEDNSNILFINNISEIELKKDNFNSGDLIFIKNKKLSYSICTFDKDKNIFKKDNKDLCLTSKEEK